MANLTRPDCPLPFINELDWPFQGGYLEGRFCAKVASLGNASCCVPCPLQDWVYSDGFDAKVNAAFWSSLPTLLLQIFLMLSFCMLPNKDSHGHYLNWGLTISVSLLALCMIVPLAANPEMCHDPITPNDMYTSQSCAWSGALLLAGAMGIVAWVIMRSLYTHLRVVWGIELPRWYPILSHVVGWGLPGLGLAISLPLTGLSYQVSSLCLLKKNGSFSTFFGWYLSFSAIAGVIQLSTTVYCLWIFAKSFSETSSQPSNTEATTQTSVDEVTQDKERDVQVISGMYRKRHGWRRVKKVLLLQWRSILLSALVVASAIYFGAVYVVLSKTAQQNISGPSDAPEVLDWALCLVLNQGNKNPCLALATRLGLSEDGAVAAFMMLALTGWFTFGLMVRSSMFMGWYHVLRNPGQYLRKLRRRRSSIEENFVMVQPEHGSRSRLVNASRAETGNASERHETTDLLNGDNGDHVAKNADDDEGREHKGDRV